MKNDIFTVYYFTSPPLFYIFITTVYSQVIIQTNTYFSGMCYEIRNRKNKTFSKGSLIDFSFKCYTISFETTFFDNCHTLFRKPISQTLNN